MEINIEILLSEILPYLSYLITYLKKKKIFHKTILSLLMIIIIILSIFIINFLIKVYNCNKSIKESLMHNSFQLNIIDELTTSINTLKDQIEKLTKHTNSLEYNLTTYQYIYPIITNEINHLKNKVSPLYHHFLALSNLSSIIEGVDELMMVFKWIPLIAKTSIENILIFLLYKGSRDSDDKSIFHLDCDNKSPFLVLIKGKGKITNPQTNQTEEVTIRIGAITNAKIQSNQKFIKVLDDDLALFSLDNGGKYKIDRSYSGLYTGKEMLINIGFVIYLADNWKHKPNKLFVSRPYKDKSAYLYQDNYWPYQDGFYTAEEMEFFHIQTNHAIN